MKSGIPSALAVLLAVSCAHAQFPDIHPRLKAGKVVVRRAVILPAGVSFEKVGMKGAEEMTEEAERLSETLYSVVSKELSVRGVEILPKPLEGAHSDAERYALSDLQTRYDSLLIQLHRGHLHVDQGRYSLGDGVSTFGPAKGADAIVFLRARAVLLTPGKRAFSAAVMAFENSEVYVELALADSKTGDILAFVRVLKSGDMTQDKSAALEHSFRNAFRDVPFPLKAPKN